MKSPIKGGAGGDICSTQAIPFVRILFSHLHLQILSDVSFSHLHPQPLQPEIFSREPARSGTAGAAVPGEGNAFGTEVSGTGLKPGIYFYMPRAHDYEQADSRSLSVSLPGPLS